MWQTEKCLENKQFILFWGKTTLSSFENTNKAGKK